MRTEVLGRAASSDPAFLRGYASMRGFAPLTRSDHVFIPIRPRYAFVQFSRGEIDGVVEIPAGTLVILLRCDYIKKPEMESSATAVRLMTPAAIEMRQESG